MDVELELKEVELEPCSFDEVLCELKNQAINLAAHKAVTINQHDFEDCYQQIQVRIFELVTKYNEQKLPCKDKQSLIKYCSRSMKNVVYDYNRSKMNLSNPVFIADIQTVTEAHECFISPTMETIVGRQHAIEKMSLFSSKLDSDNWEQTQLS